MSEEHYPPRLIAMLEAVWGEGCSPMLPMSCEVAQMFPKCYPVQVFPI